MKNSLKGLAFCAAAALVSANVVAQTQSSSSDPNQTSSSGSAQQNASLNQTNAQEFFRASELVSKNAQDSKGNKVGEIKEIAFNQQGQIFVFVDVGSGKWAAVPWQVIQPATAKGNGNVTLNATTQQLKAGPAVTKEDWGSLNNPKFVEGCYGYYNVQSPVAAGAASSPGGSSQSQGQNTPAQPQQ
jgi:PRC-barrel domain